MNLKHIYTIAALALAPALANAQNYYVEPDKTFYGGPVVGVNFTQVDGDNFAGYGKVGLNLGAIVYKKFGDFAASMEILYVQKGATGFPKESGLKGLILEEYSAKLNYAEVPINFYYKDPNGHHFGLGISYARLVSAEETVKTNFPYDFKLDEHPYKKSDINFLINVNFKVYKGLFVNGRFQYSLVPARTDVPSGLGRKEQFNNVVALRLVYIFGGF